MKKKKQMSELETLADEAYRLMTGLDSYRWDLEADLEAMPDKEKAQEAIDNIMDAMNDAEAVHRALYLALHPEEELP